MCDRQQHHIGGIAPGFRNRPLRLDHAADAAQMLDKADALAIRRMNHLDPQSA
jgi:hypothetical protein